MTVRKLIAIDCDINCKVRAPDWPRVETGAVQFHDDWPGLFIRGDNCIDLWNRLQGIKTLLESHVPDKEKSELTYMIGMPAINDLIRMIKEDVLLKPGADLPGVS